VGRHQTMSELIKISTQTCFIRCQMTTLLHPFLGTIPKKCLLKFLNKENENEKIDLTKNEIPKSFKRGTLTDEEIKEKLLNGEDVVVEDIVYNKPKEGEETDDTNNLLDQDVLEDEKTYFVYRTTVNLEDGSIVSETVPEKNESRTVIKDSTGEVEIKVDDKLCSFLVSNEDDAEKYGLDIEKLIEKK